MAGKTDLGGIFFKLGLDLDKNSFESGNKQINNASESMNKLIGTARNAAVALVSIKSIGKLGTFADAESSAYKTSKALGITTESLKTWKAAAKIAGVDANSLVNSMGQLGSVISHIKIDGRGLDEYSKKLQEIGLGITDLKDKEGNWLSADKAFQKVIAKGQEEYAKAKTEEEQLLVITKMGDILGSAGQDFFIALNAMGMTIEQFRQGAGKSVWTTNKNTKDAMAFSTEWNTLSNSLSQIGALFGADVARELTDSVKGINEWLATNGDTIKNALDKIAKKIGGVVEAAVNEHSAARSPDPRSDPASLDPAATARHIPPWCAGCPDPPFAKPSRRPGSSQKATPSAPHTHCPNASAQRGWGQSGLRVLRSFLRTEGYGAGFVIHSIHNGQGFQLVT